MNRNIYYDNETATVHGLKAKNVSLFIVLTITTYSNYHMVVKFKSETKRRHYFPLAIIQ